MSAQGSQESGFGQAAKKSKSFMDKKTHRVSRR